MIRCGSCCVLLVNPVAQNVSTAKMPITGSTFAQLAEELFQSIISSGTAIETITMPRNRARAATGWLVTKSFIGPAMRTTISPMPMSIGISSHQSTSRKRWPAFARPFGRVFTPSRKTLAL